MSLHSLLKAEGIADLGDTLQSNLSFDFFLNEKNVNYSCPKGNSP